MLNTAILDIVIALAFTYFILALMVSSINEGISSILNMRGNMLKESLFNLFYAPDNEQTHSGTDITKESNKEVDELWQQSLKKILDCPHIDSLRTRADKFPKYIPPKNFVLAMMQFLKEQTNSKDENNLLTELKTQLDKDTIPLIKGKFKDKLLGFIDKAQGDIEQFKKEIEDFYNSSVSHLRDWYRRKVKVLMFVYGLTLALAFNVDTFYMGKVLWQNPKQATEFLATIQQYDAAKKDNSAKTDSTVQKIMQNTLQDISKNYKALKPLPIGWNKTKVQEMKEDAWAMIHKIFGWLITAMAVSLGAPFWYELFNKLLSVRKAIAPAAPAATPAPQPQVQPQITIPTPPPATDTSKEAEKPKE